MLGPLLFIIYTNDIDEGLINRILKFTDDPKLFGFLSNGDDVEMMRGRSMQIMRLVEGMVDAI